MSNYILSCSSTVDIPRSYLKEKNVPFVSFHYGINDKEYIDDMGESMSYEEFYDLLKQKVDTRTSQVNADEYVKFFKPFLQAGLDVIHLELSSGISGSYNSACIAKDFLQEKFPERKIIIVDSLAASSGFGLLLDSVIARRDEGATIEELQAYAEEIKLNVHHWFFSTNLEYYFKGGRISKTSFVLGSLLNICPVLNVSDVGKLTPRKKVHGKRAAIKEMIKQMIENAENGADYNKKVYICNSACYEDAKLVADLVKQNFPKMDGEVLINNIGTTIGSHTGVGTVALFFFGKKREN